MPFVHWGILARRREHTPNTVNHTDCIDLKSSLEAEHSSATELTLAMLI
ncbi:hypothetical protein J8Z24_18825 [Pseudoalteromonas sp. SCSIO 43201]|nr:hypothetical protein [Pseudoalteromonas sp. SCSIO 43201]USD31013.1 hypothetical protein J8Z24_18825 [Pseudoalteromonas sp. SCSIO 43201]